MDPIGQMELRIEELAEAIQRSKILMKLGNIAAVGGSLLLLALLVGVMRFIPEMMITGVGLGRGGVVLMGSSNGFSGSREHS